MHRLASHSARPCLSAPVSRRATAHTTRPWASAASRPLNVLISGAGVAGPAAAFWLSKLGHSCTVVERFPKLRAHGQQVDLRLQGVSVARRMGMLDEIRARSVDEEGTEFVDARGQTLAFFAKSASDEHQSWTSDIEIMRGELCRIMYEATRQSVAYRFDMTIRDFDNVDGDKNGRVRVVFSDGRVDVFDLLIGADGQNSSIRKRLTPRDSYRALGAFICYFNMSRSVDDEQNRFRIYWAGKRRLLATRWHSQDLGQGYLMTMSHAEEMQRAMKADARSQKKLFADIFRGAGWQADRLVDEMQRADDYHAHEAVQITAPSWSKGRVVLLGDAAHAASLFTGMGTSLALIGAYVLAGEIARHANDIPAALRAYDRTLRPFVQEMQKLSPGLPGLMFPDSAFRVKLFQLTVSLTAVLKLDTMASALASYMVPKGDKWKLPEYPELEKVRVDSSPHG